MLQNRYIEYEYFKIRTRNKGMNQSDMMNYAFFLLDSKNKEVH